MIISITEKPYIVEKKLEQMKSIRYKNKMFRVQKKKDTWIITMVMGAGRYSSTFKWELLVEDEKLNITRKKTFSAAISRGSAMFTVVIVTLSILGILMELIRRTMQGYAVNTGEVLVLSMLAVMEGICIWYIIQTSNRHIEMELISFLKEMLKSNE